MFVLQPDCNFLKLIILKSQIKEKQLWYPNSPDEEKIKLRDSDFPTSKKLIKSYKKRTKTKNKMGLTIKSL